MRVIEVGMEQLWNERVGETEDPRENSPTKGIARHDSHMRKSGVCTPCNTPATPPNFPDALLAFSRMSTNEKLSTSPSGTLVNKEACWHHEGRPEIPVLWEAWHYLAEKYGVSSCTRKGSAHGRRISWTHPCAIRCWLGCLQTVIQQSPVFRQNRDSSFNTTRHQSASCHAACSQQKVTCVLRCSGCNVRHLKRHISDICHSANRLDMILVDIRMFPAGVKCPWMVRSDTCGVLTACCTMKLSFLLMICGVHNLPPAPVSHNLVYSISPGAFGRVEALPGNLPRVANLHSSTLKPDVIMPLASPVAGCLLRIIRERYIEKGREIYAAFIDLEKIFDRVQWNKLMGHLEEERSRLERETTSIESTFTTGVRIKIETEMSEESIIGKLPMISTITKDLRCHQKVKTRIAVAKKVFNRKRRLLCRKLDKALRKRLGKCLVWSVALYGAETMERISWVERVSSEEVLVRVDERQTAESHKRKEELDGTLVEIGVLANRRYGRNKVGRRQESMESYQVKTCLWAQSTNDDDAYVFNFTQSNHATISTFSTPATATIPPDSWYPTSAAGALQVCCKHECGAAEISQGAVAWDVRQQEEAGAVGNMLRYWQLDALSVLHDNSARSPCNWILLVQRTVLQRRLVRNGHTEAPGCPVPPCLPVVVLNSLLHIQQSVSQACLKKSYPQDCTSAGRQNRRKERRALQRELAIQFGIATTCENASPSAIPVINSRPISPSILLDHTSELDTYLGICWPWQDLDHMSYFQPEIPARAATVSLPRKDKGTSPPDKCAICTASGKSIVMQLRRYIDCSFMACCSQQAWMCRGARSISRVDAGMLALHFCPLADLSPFDVLSTWFFATNKGLAAIVDKGEESEEGSYLVPGVTSAMPPGMLGGQRQLREEEQTVRERNANLCPLLHQLLCAHQRSAGHPTAVNPCPCCAGQPCFRIPCSALARLQIKPTIAGWSPASVTALLCPICLRTVQLGTVQPKTSRAVENHVMNIERQLLNSKSRNQTNILANKYNIFQFTTDPFDVPVSHVRAKHHNYHVHAQVFITHHTICFGKIVLLTHHIVSIVHPTHHTLHRHASRVNRGVVNPPSARDIIATIEHAGSLLPSAHDAIFHAFRDNRWVLSPPFVRD
ncbi:hypothetical protein PR048_001011 [Dryococelus australis]|uniref:Reverse transcriptase domain-containing protein n=1 Tax=Dryococelus australis TaxID=614101 RepID=A0ABQ9IHM8_9NEOP|nr:hypothetical protein PR048_001011 [Dryococelus australis]